MAKNAKWEYHTERLVRPANEAKLVKLGKQGWELVNFLWVPILSGSSSSRRAEGYFHYVFKKRRA